MRLSRVLAAVLVLLAAAVMPAAAWAQAVAALDRSRIALGDSVTLHIESASSGQPDYAPLRQYFDVGAQSSSRQIGWENGRSSQRFTYEVSLTPRRSGNLQVPALAVGAQRTAPLALQVTEATPAAADGTAVAFVQTEVDDSTPYVQQSVGVVVRLFFASQLASGSLVLDTPEGASLQMVGQDRSDVREVNGRRYNVVERRYLLIPERSGALQLAGARFDGRSAGGYFQDVFGDGEDRLRATGPAQTLQVQAQPVGAARPWLPLHDLRLRYLTTPAQARTGEAVTLVVEAVASGATRAQFTELPVPDLGDAAQVFAEPPQYDETFPGGTPQLTVTRRYSIVPRAAGTMQVPGMRLQWWDVAAGQPRVSSLPPLQIAVAPGRAASNVPDPPMVDPVGPPSNAGPEQPLGADSDVTGATAAVTAWYRQPVLWLGLAVVLVLLGWLIWRRDRRGGDAAPAVDGAPAAPLSVAAAAPTASALRQALLTEDLGGIAVLLCRMAQVDSLEQVAARLADPAQQAAVQALQQARWGGTANVPLVRRTLQQAFHEGPHWTPASTTAKTVLAPLYPPRRG